MRDAGEVLGWHTWVEGVTGVAVAAAVPVMRPRLGCRVSHAHLPSTCSWLALHVLAPRRCDYLNSKNTIFGKVVGDTIYNTLRLNDVEVSELWQAA